MSELDENGANITSSNLRTHSNFHGLQITADVYILFLRFVILVVAYASHIRVISFRSNQSFVAAVIRVYCVHSRSFNRLFKHGDILKSCKLFRRIEEVIRPFDKRRFVLLSIWLWIYMWNKIWSIRGIYVIEKDEILVKMDHRVNCVKTV